MLQVDNPAVPAPSQCHAVAEEDANELAFPNSPRLWAHRIRREWHGLVPSGMFGLAHLWPLVLRAAVKSNITNLENASLFNVLEVVYEFLFSALGAPNMSFVQNK